MIAELESPADWAVEYYAVTHDPWSLDERRLMADGLELLLKPPQGARFLDLACGDGGLSVELAGRGYGVVGLDRSEALLADAKLKAKTRMGSATWLAADMRQIPLAEAFDAALLFCWAFGYFDDEQNIQVLQGAHNSLRTGGCLLIDTHVVETLGPSFDRITERRVGQRLDREDRRWNPKTGRVESVVTSLQDGHERTVHGFIRVYTFKELAKMLRDIGFVSCEGFSGSLEHGRAYGGITTRPFEPGAQRLLLVASK